MGTEVRKTRAERFIFSMFVRRVSRSVSISAAFWNKVLVPKSGGELPQIMRFAVVSEMATTAISTIGGSWFLGLSFGVALLVVVS